MGMIIQNGKQYFPVYNDTEIKALPTVDTASGAIATFNTDLTENLVSVKCQIVAKQASGTPSPVNPLPITTYNQLNLARIGNTDKMSWLQGVTSGVCGIVNLGSLTWTKTSNFFRAETTLPQINGTNSIISKNYTIGNPYAIPDDDIYLIFNQGVSQLIFVIRDLDYSDVPTFTNAMNGVYAIYKLATPTFPTTYTASDFNAMLTAFEIDGSLHNIPFGQTVANSVIDITSGNLRVTHGIKLFKGDATEGWFDASTAGITRFAVINSDMKSSNTRMELLSNIAVFSLGNENNIIFGVTIGGSNLIYYYPDSTVTSLSDLRTFLSNTNMQVVYPLETPIEVQLDSITLQALLNENNIWCDTGDTEVKYLLSVGKKIA